VRSPHGLRVAYSPAFGVFAVEKDVSETCRHAVNALCDAGMIVEEDPFSLPCSQDELAWLWRRQVGVCYAEFFAALEAAGTDLDLDDDDVPSEVRDMARYGQRVTALETRKDSWLRTRVLFAIEDLFERYDLLVTPTVSCLPVANAADGRTLGPSTVDGTSVERCIGWCLTHPINFTGHPAASVPAGLSAEGLPVGLQIIGRRHQDASVLGACRAIEQRRPWLKDLERACAALLLAS
jgi:amidase/aspartyl-tRNA(Asn)/glutamyl-tRNA(Gln) amidotransferase subunit A